MSKYRSMELIFRKTEEKSETETFNQLLQELKKKGGGTLKVQSGTYTLGTIILISNLRIVFEPGTHILFSPNEDEFADGEILDYNTYADFETSLFCFSMFYGDELENITIEGPARIVNSTYPRGGPKPFAIKSTIGLRISDITIERAPNYNISLIDCENVVISKVRIENALCDGIDLDGCRMVQIDNCIVDSWDDGICLKSSMALGQKLFSSNLTLTNCMVSSSCNCIKIGTETHGDFEDIAISNCTLFPRAFQRQAQSAIAIESADGSNIRGVVITNITSRNHKCLLFIQLGNRHRAAEIGQIGGSINDIIVSNLIGSGVTYPIIINGLRNNRVQNVKIRDVIMNYRKDEVKRIPLEKITDCDAKYPDPDMFGGYPASVVFVRNAENIQISSLSVSCGFFDDYPLITIGHSRNIYIDGLDIRCTDQDTTEIPFKLKRVDSENVELQNLRSNKPFTK